MFFLSYLHDVPQKVQYFFSFFETFCTKIRKTAFFELFARRPTKSRRKQCFFMFFKALCTKFAKNAKNSVFLAFCTTSHKKCEKTVFFTFFEAIHTKLAKNAKKTAFFELSARRSIKSVWKQCSFHVLQDTLYNVRKKMQKTPFLSFRRDIPQKVWENRVFPRLSRQRFLQKNANISVLWSSCATLSKMCFFSRFSRYYTQSSQIMWKQRFLSFLREIPRKVRENNVFFSSFSRHFVQISLEMLNNSVFPTKSVRKKYVFIMLFYHVVSVFFHVFQYTLYIVNNVKQRSSIVLGDVPQNVWENSDFFSRFSWHFVQCSLKIRKKKRCFLSLCATFHKKFE